MADSHQLTADADVPESVTFREVQEVIRTFRDSGWTGMTLELHGMRVVIGKDGPPRGAGAAPAAAVAAGGSSGSGSTPATDTTGCVAVNSPAVGSFWVSPSPGQPPFVQVGQAVAEDEQLGIVEVMKLMNPVVSPTAGEVAAVCAANAELVEYEQVLFWIRPSDE
jgi:acetyl-CoA carboxylase biotin carboxyl carrier protein